MGVPKPGCFKPVCNFYAEVRSSSLFCGLAFAFLWGHLRVSASGRVSSDRVWELQKNVRKSSRNAIFELDFVCLFGPFQTFSSDFGPDGNIREQTRHIRNSRKKVTMEMVGFFFHN